MDNSNFDVIIIGGGQGAALAKQLARDGQKTALIEKQYIGGTCVNIGCTPTKALYNCAKVAQLARRASDYGLCIPDVEIDWPAMQKRTRRIVQEFREHSEKELQIENLTLLYGTARFVGHKQIEVQANDSKAQLLQAETIVIAAGARPRVPELPGLEAVPFLNEASLLDLDKVPQHLIILGGGYLAVEFGQMFRRFGAEVSIVENENHLLGKEDEDIAAELGRILREDGLEIHLNSKAQKVRCVDDKIEIEIKNSQGEKLLRGSHLLVAVGRQSNADKLNLTATSVKTDEQGFIQVNNQLETNVPGIYAMGDIKGGPLFTHIAYDDARILCANLSENKHLNIKDRLVPYTVFSDPQLGRIGLTEREAKVQKLKFRVAKLPLCETARGIEAGETRGFWKVLVECQTDRILGGAFLSLEGGEMAAVLQVAMMGQLPYTALRDATLSHPTLAESFNNLFLTLDREAKSLEHL